MQENRIDANKELLVELKKLANSDNCDGLYKEIAQIKKKWHFAKDEASYYEQELQDQFDLYLSKIYEKLNANSKDAKEKKEELIEKAKSLLNNENFKKNSPIMKQLLDEWKVAGRSDKETDDSLWEEFNSVRQSFYDKRQAYYDNIQKQFAQNEQAKLALIDEATKANEIEDIKTLTDKMNELMKSWKAVKSATKEKDDELWAKFNEQRQIFYKKKNSYIESMKEVWNNRANQKKELIQQAKHYLAMSEFTKEEIAAVEDIRKKWKEIGSAGREQENELWTTFSTIINKYLDNKKYYI